MAYALAYKGKATSDIAYNLEDPPSTYSNESVHSRLDGYTSMARQVHGPEYDPSAHDLDGEVVMRAGGGKEAWPVLDWRRHNRHGQYSHSLPDSSTEHRF